MLTASTHCLSERESRSSARGKQPAPNGPHCSRVTLQTSPCQKCPTAALRFQALPWCLQTNPRRNAELRSHLGSMASGQGSLEETKNAFIFYSVQVRSSGAVGKVLKHFSFWMLTGRGWLHSLKNVCEYAWGERSVFRLPSSLHLSTTTAQLGSEAAECFLLRAGKSVAN